MKKKFCLIVWLLICFFLAETNAQILSSKLSQNSNLLFQKAQRGNKIALKNLGGQLSNPNEFDLVIEALKNCTNFTESELNWSKIKSKKDFLNFWNGSEEQLVFSPVLRSFFLTPIENRKVDFSIVASKSVSQNSQNPYYFLQKIYESFAINDKNAAIRYISELKNSSIIESPNICLQIFQNKDNLNSQLNTEGEVLEALIDGLPRNTQKDVIANILQLIDNQTINYKKILPKLEWITNIQTKDISEAKYVTTQYRKFLANLQSNELLREFGYLQVSRHNPMYFYEDVDYFGYLLNDIDVSDFTHLNALFDLMELHHSKSLFYLSAAIYTRRNDIDWTEKLQKIFSQYLDSQVFVKNAKQKYTDSAPASDKVWWDNYINFWASNYQNFTWEDEYKKFVNLSEIRKDFSKIDAFFKLNPSKNRDTFVNISKKIIQQTPFLLKTFFLENAGVFQKNKLTAFEPNAAQLIVLSKLYQYYQKQGISCDISPIFLPLTQSLKAENISDDTRYNLENQCIATISFRDIHALELDGILNVSNENYGFSVARICTYFYQKNMQKIVTNEEYLENYLTKTLLFSQLNSTGFCAKYYEQLSNLLPNYEKNKCAKLLKITSNTHVGQFLHQLLAQKTNFSIDSVANFIAQPLLYSYAQIKKLPPPTALHQQVLIDSLKSANLSEYEIYTSYVFLYPNCNFSKIFVNFLENEDKRQLAALALEKIYQFKMGDAKGSFKPYQAWAAWAKNRSENPSEWYKLLFDSQLDKLKQDAKLTIDDFNNLILSNQYDNNAHRNICIAALPKLFPASSLVQLRLKPMPKISESLYLLRNSNYSYKGFEQVLSFFEVDNSELFLDYILEKIEFFPENERANIANLLFDQTWFGYWLNQANSDSKKVKTIENYLHNYLINNTLITEFEERKVNLHLLEIQNRTLSPIEKIKKSLTENLNPDLQQAWQKQLFSQISYSQIDTLLPFFDKIKPNIVTEFLQDLGFPISKCSNQELTDFQRSFKKFSKKDLYFAYLKPYNLDLLDLNGEPNFLTINKVLQVDNIANFAGSSNKKRELLSFGVVKYLENYFQTALNFHEKLSEGQNFYAYNVTKRAAAWSNYLKAKGFLKSDSRNVAY